MQRYRSRFAWLVLVAAGWGAQLWAEPAWQQIDAPDSFTDRNENTA